MSDQDGDDFELRPAPPRSRGDDRAGRFAARVRQAVGKRLPTGTGQRVGAIQGRGQVAAHRAGRSRVPGARRVVVKIRLVRTTTLSQRPTAMHLKYIERDGVGLDGEPGHAYGPAADVVDVEVFREQLARDRHHFRIIIAPEDGASLGELRPYIRQLMRTVDRDLGCGTDWIAVDHWNTDNPHSHLVVRGRDTRGRDLVIAPDYIAQGLRSRASELATHWLGPRTEWEIDAALQRDTLQERWTALDQVLQHHQHDQTLYLSASTPPTAQEALLRGRLQTLERLGLAIPAGTDQWQMRPDWTQALRRLGERGDIIRTLQRAMGGAHRELAVFDGNRDSPTVIGRVVGRGLVDELSDRGYLAVDALDGRAHYVALPSSHTLDDYPLGAVVEARAGGARAIDAAIAAQAKAGIYRAQDVKDDDRLAQVRRLEALRRAGLVSRVADGIWAMPADLPERGRLHDVQQMGGAIVSLRCHLPIEQQVSALGATWLDQQLVGKSDPATAAGFAADVREALEARKRFLVEQGWARRVGARVIVARNLLATLRQRELVDVAQRIRVESGLTHRPVFDGVRISGTYRRAVQLVSGRYALIDDGSGFSLVPWRPVIDKHLGQPLSVTVMGQRTSWEFGRQRELAR